MKNLAILEDEKCYRFMFIFFIVFFYAIMYGISFCFVIHIILNFPDKIIYSYLVYHLYMSICIYIDC